MDENYVCSLCGKPAYYDGRGGSLDVILSCDCQKNGVWINDGRGGYWATKAKPIKAEEFASNHGMT